MNAILGMAYLALKTDLDPRQRDYVSKIHGAGSLLLCIINDILDFSKIEAGRLEVETVDFSFLEIIEQVTGLLAQRVQEKGLEFLIDIDREVPTHLRGDPLRLGQVFTNLIGNAVKFTLEGNIRLRAEVIERKGRSVHLSFRVEDTGIGMSEEQIERLFQAFNQADSSITRRFGGTGLGLTISKRLVEMMGGEISVTSETGVGSVFEVRVWLEVGKEVARSIPESIRGLHCLIVDDSRSEREIMQSYLDDMGLHTDLAISGIDGLACVLQKDQDDPYDIVFLDWKMPEMDGLEMVRQLRANFGLRHQPKVILVTAYGQDSLRDEAVLMCIDAMITKPVNPSSLHDALVQILCTEERRVDAVAGQGKQASLTSLRGVRVLLAEDNEINQQIAVEVLELSGASVAIANNGLEAVRYLAEEHRPCDIVLMDLQMPEMDGLQATAIIRATPGYENLPIIAMTAHAMVEERERCLAVGMNDHIAKPIDPAAVCATVARWVELNTSRGEDVKKVATLRAPVDVGRKMDIPILSGIDVREGLSRLMNNDVLYRKLLRQFAEGRQNTVGELDALFAAGRYEEAAQVAHMLRGLAANLGAHDLAFAAEAVERKINDGNSVSELERQLEILRGSLGEVVSAIREGLPSIFDDIAWAAPMGGEELRNGAEALERLRELIAGSDSEARDVLEKSRRYLETLLGSNPLEELRQAVNGFDFVRAEAILESMLSQTDADNPRIEKYLESE